MVAEATFCLHRITDFKEAEHSNHIGNRCIRNYSKLKNHSLVHLSVSNVFFGPKRVKIFQITYLGSRTFIELESDVKIELNPVKRDQNVDFSPKIALNTVKTV